MIPLIRIKSRLFFRRILPCAVLYSSMLLVFSVSAQFTPDSSHRKRFNFNIGWKFYLGTPSGSPESASFNDASWDDICLPHTLKEVSKNLDNSNDDAQQLNFHRLVGWYRKHFDAPASWQDQKIFIEFEGVMETAEVWVNGTRIGEHEVSGYDPFHYDITSAVALGESNVIAVRCDNTRNLNCPPENIEIDYILFGGIYRDVYLDITDKLHVDFPWESTTSGVTITSPTASQSSAVVKVVTNVKNENSAVKSVTLVSRVLDANNAVVATMTDTYQVGAGSAHVFTQQSSSISNPHLWSPDSPYLYKVYTSVRDGTQPADGVDALTNRFGIRSIAFSSSQGFSLNGQRLKLVGLNRHQTWPWVGNAVPNTVHKREAAQMKSIGVNWIRLSHYPHDPAFLDALDSLGIMALEEGPTWARAGNTTWWNNLELSFRKMIRRDRNHPSIIIWNACINHGGCETRLEDAAHDEDPTRKTGACEVPTPMDFTLGQVSGSGALTIEHTGHTFPTKRYDNEQRQDDHAWRHAYMTSVARGKGDNSGLAGWCMYDYNSLFNDDQNIVYHGVADLFRLPKFAFYWYRAEMTSDPMVFIASYWTSNSPTTVYVYSNCEEVELFVNDQSRGTATPNTSSETRNCFHPPFLFTSQSFQSGELKAVGMIGGVERATHVVNTPGSAASIRLEADPATLFADGADFARIIASVVDNSGTVIPGATNSIRFSLSGEGRLVGDNPINAEAGKIINLAQAGLNTGTATVTATAGSLQSNTLTITFVERPPDEIPIDPTGMTRPYRRVSVSREMSAASRVWVAGNRFQVPYAKGETNVHIALYDCRGKLLKTMKVKTGTVLDTAHENLFHHGIVLVRITEEIQ